MVSGNMCLLLVDVTLVRPSGCHQWQNTLIFRSQPVACCRYEPFPVESSLAGQVLTCTTSLFALTVLLAGGTTACNLAHASCLAEMVHSSSHPQHPRPTLAMVLSALFVY